MILKIGSEYFSAMVIVTSIFTGQGLNRAGNSKKYESRAFFGGRRLEKIVCHLPAVSANSSRGSHRRGGGGCGVGVGCGGGKTKFWG